MAHKQYPLPVDVPIEYATRLDTSMDPDHIFAELLKLDWVEYVPARMEYYCGRNNMPYTYGQGRGTRTYDAQPIAPIIEEIWRHAENTAKCKFDVCFLNRYKTQSNYLGWHADNSAEMDDDRPIAIVTYGAVREIGFAPIGNLEEESRLQLAHGSICLMLPGMQDTHVHRIPKAGYVVGERISLTFRGYV